MSVEPLLRIELTHGSTRCSCGFSALFRRTARVCTARNLTHCFCFAVSIITLFRNQFRLSLSDYFHFGTAAELGVFIWPCSVHATTAWWFPHTHLIIGDIVVSQCVVIPGIKAKWSSIHPKPSVCRAVVLQTCPYVIAIQIINPKLFFISKGTETLISLTTVIWKYTGLVFF